MNNPFFLSARGIAAGGLVAAALIVAVAGRPALAAETTNSVPDPAKLSRSVGLDIVSRTLNPDKSVSLVFKWNDKGTPRQRTVVANEATIVVYNGELRKLTDLSEQDYRAKAVATVGADGITAVVLRFGKAPLPKNKLTPAQLALLATLAPPPPPLPRRRWTNAWPRLSRPWT